ncbi:ribosome biogenesis GTPase Der [Patescibacteria group bacterium]|nr:ribosome biogenesis GTPase Der [Patescibacteria group bacterium]MBU1922246.1 ribosome biogenesis GTPase Der [Patescibacteria group bacterium]
MNKENKKPIIAIIGRTNVGKSTLFNRLAEQNKALISAIPGTTRDRNYADCLWQGRLIQVVDTGGLQKRGKGAIELATEKQVKLASNQADLIYFIVDVREGPTPQDMEVIKFLRQCKKPVILIANKADNQKFFSRKNNPQWKKFGLGLPFAISAASGSGVGDLLDATYEKFESLGLAATPIEKINAIKIAILGKPNVGKSSLVNALCGEERMIVSDIAFTTREPQDTFIKYENENYVLIDTAGIRKHSKIKKGLEQKGVEKTKKILEQTDIVLLVLDMSEPLGLQDKKLASLIAESRKSLIVIANKSDLLREKEISVKQLTDLIHSFLSFVSWAPLAIVSAKTGKNVKKIFHTTQQVRREYQKRIQAKELEKFIKYIVKKVKPIAGPGMAARPRVLAMKQTNIKPPTFEVAVRATEVLHPNYLKYIEKQLRENFGFDGTPVIVKSKSLKR